MKNLIEPQKLEELKKKPVTYTTIDEFLKSSPEASAGLVCKVLGIPPTSYYSWRERKKKTESIRKSKENQPGSNVIPTGNSKRKYSPEEKVTLLRDYQRLEEGKRGEFLRNYGLYSSDLERWRDVADQASIEALSQKKQGRIPKSKEQLRIEELERELQGQEKVITKLSALVVIQKKVSTILGIPDPT